MTSDPGNEYLEALARIERNQAEFSHELTSLRADLAMLTGRQNSKIADAKKKLKEMPVSSKPLPVVF